MFTGNKGNAPFLASHAWHAHWPRFAFSCCHTPFQPQDTLGSVAPGTSKMQACCHVPSSQGWLQSGHSPIKPRFVKCCRDCCPSSRFSHLRRNFVILSEWSLHSCPVAQFGQTASSRKSLISYILFPFPNDGSRCALGNFQHSRNRFLHQPRSMPLHNSVEEFYGQVLGLHGGVSALTCTDNCWTLQAKMCFFLCHVQSIKLATDRLQSSCRDSSRMIKGNWIQLISIWSVIAKRLNTF